MTAVEIGVASQWVSLAPVVDRLDVAFESKALAGSWRTEPLDLAATGAELRSLYESLRGKVLLSDNSSLGITFAASNLGGITADVHIEGWPFEVEGHLKFVVPVQHGQLLQLARALGGGEA